MNEIAIMNIVLLIVSAICFVISFLIPEKKPEGSGIDQELAKQEVHEMVEREAEALREPLNSMALEYAGVALEAAVKNLDDASNEKFFEITNYSDTVLREIRKEEEEVVALHEAVKEEKESLRETVAAAGKAAKSMRETVEKIQAMRPVEVSYGGGSVKIAPVASKVGDKSSESKKREKASQK